ncbi:type II methionyl aminopeptidase [Candidatus Woesearchaeota archaeon]|nr:type II methionyl aminopeptidase [Candidatus Woesearchaeota archaeon]
MAEDVEKWRKACSISAQALQHGISLIKKGASVIDVCNAVDRKIVELGGKPAFPAQISLDSIAAHYCCPHGDKTIFDSQVAKLDCGAHVDGIPGDNAATVDLSGNNSELVKASRNALNAAIKIVKPGIKLSEIGEVIQGEITSLGFSPIRNLSGHGIDRFELHTRPTVPNFNNNDSTVLSSGQIIAIEPFATTGEGIVNEGESAEVFMLLAHKPVRDAAARKILELIESYEGLPFAKRWLIADFPQFKVELALRQLQLTGAVKGFPPLVEKARGLVSQAEHTVLVTDSGCEVLTRLS